MDWTPDEEEDMRNAALQLIKKRELSWEDNLSTRIASLIDEIEADNESIERSIQTVTSLQVDEVRQSTRVLDAMAPQAAALGTKFTDVEALMSLERGNIKDFKQLKQVNAVLERLTSVINTADTLVSLQRRFVDLTSPQTAVAAVCSEIFPVYQFQQDLSDSSDPKNREAIDTFSTSHFQLLGSVATTVIDRLRITFMGFAAKGNDIHELNLPNDADLEALIYNELSDALRVISNEGYARMLTHDPSLYNRSEAPHVAQGGMWGIVLYWIGVGADRLWHTTLGCAHSDGKVNWQDMPRHLNAWINAVDRVIFYMLKDAHDEPEESVFVEGLWETRERALDVAKVLIDNAHEKVQDVVKRCLDVLGGGGGEDIGPPDILSIRWWISDYDTRITSCFSGMGMELRPSSRQPVAATEEGRKDVVNKAGLLLRHASQSLKSWLAGKAEVMASVLVRDCLFAAPTHLQMHEEYRLITPGPIDLLDLLETQVMEISRFNDSHALESLAVGFQLAAAGFCSVIRKEVTLDLVPTFEALGAEHVEYPLRLLCAVANDMARCEHELLRMERIIKERVPPQNQCNVRTDGAVTIVKETRDAMMAGVAAFVDNTCKDSWTGMFSAYDESERRAQDHALPKFLDVLKTLQDYAPDLREWLHRDNWRQLAKRLAAGVEKEYLQGFVTMAHSKKALSSGRVLHADYVRLRQLVADRSWAPAEVSKALPCLSGMIDSGTTDKCREYIRQLFDAFPDTPAGLGRIIIPKLTTFTDKERKALAEEWFERVVETVEGGGRTMMGSLNVPELTGIRGWFESKKEPRGKDGGKRKPDVSPQKRAVTPPRAPPSPRREPPREPLSDEIKCQSLADFLN